MPTTNYKYEKRRKEIEKKKKKDEKLRRKQEKKEPQPGEDKSTQSPTEQPENQE